MRGDESVVEGEDIDEEPDLDGADAPAFAAARKQLSDAVARGDSQSLQTALASAQALGVQGRATRRARDALLALEAADYRRRTGMAVEEAIESDDWWRLQAAMQLLVGGAGGHGSHAENDIARLREAMRMQKRRQEAVKEMRRAAEARDAARLRAAVEAALLARVKEAEIARARTALRALEARPALRAQLQEAVRGKGAAALLKAIEAAQAAGFGERGPELLNEDPEEAPLLDAARRELREALLRDLRAAAGGDAGRLAEAIEAARRAGASAAEIAAASAEVAEAKDKQGLEQRLQEAARSGDKQALEEAIRAAEAAPRGAAPSGAVLEGAREALSAIERRAQEEEARRRAADELSQAMQGEDVHRLSTALAVAEALGLGSHGRSSTGTALLGPARERLRWLQSQAGVAKELRDACQSPDLYRLRAAIAAAQAAGAPERELRAAGELLRGREGQARVRQAIQAAISQGDQDGLRRAIREAGQLGLGRQELAQAEDALGAMGQARVGQDLRDAMSAGDADRLRRLAATPGLPPEEVARAWDRLRELEAAAWLRRQLSDAAASGDTVRLQVAIAQAEVGGLDKREVEAARRQLEGLLSKQQARQELILARSSGNPYSIQAALNKCERAGLTKEELSVAAADPSSGSTAPQTRVSVPLTRFDLPEFTTNPQLHTQTLSSVLTDPQLLLHTAGTNVQLSSVATQPQFSSVVTIPPALASSLATNAQFSSVATDAHLHTGSAIEGALLAPPATLYPRLLGAEQPGLSLLQNRMKSQPLRQPLPDEPPLSVFESYCTPADLSRRPNFTPTMRL